MLLYDQDSHWLRHITETERENYAEMWHCSLNLSEHLLPAGMRDRALKHAGTWPEGIQHFLSFFEEVNQTQPRVQAAFLWGNDGLERLLGKGNVLLFSFSKWKLDSETVHEWKVITLKNHAYFFMCFLLLLGEQWLLWCLCNKGMLKLMSCVNV